jgi:hypothetical protein
MFGPQPCLRGRGNGRHSPSSCRRRRRSELRQTGELGLKVHGFQDTIHAVLLGRLLEEPADGRVGLGGWRGGGGGRGGPRLSLASSSRCIRYGRLYLQGGRPRLVLRCAATITAGPDSYDEKLKRLSTEVKENKLTLCKYHELWY